MENSPYQPPESNLETDSEFKRSVWWKVYFFFITILTAVGMAMFLAEPAAGLAEYASLLFWLVATVGLFGFVFLKPIFKPQFWLITLIVYLIFTVSYFFITNIDLRMGMSDTEYYINNAIGVLFSLPGYYGLYAFSKPGDPAWKNT